MKLISLVGFFGLLITTTISFAHNQKAAQSTHLHLQAKAKVLACPCPGPCCPDPMGKLIKNKTTLFPHLEQKA